MSNHDPHLTSLRLAHFTKAFGPVHLVHHPVKPHEFHVDVCEFPPVAGRPGTVYVTDGVSNVAMPQPPEIEGEAYDRVEFVAYTKERHVGVPLLLEGMGRWLHHTYSFMDAWHTYEVARAPQDLPFRIFLTAAACKNLDTYLATRADEETFIESAVEVAEIPLGKDLAAGALVLIPITPEELRYIKARGPAHILHALTASGASIALDVPRESVV